MSPTKKMTILPTTRTISSIKKTGTISSIKKYALNKDIDILGFWTRELEVRPDQLTWMDLLHAATDMAGNPFDDKRQSSMMIQVAVEYNSSIIPGAEQKNLIRLARAAIKDTHLRVKRLMEKSRTTGEMDEREQFDRLYSQVLLNGQGIQAWNRVKDAIDKDLDQNLFKGFSGALIAIVLRASAPKSILSLADLNSDNPRSVLFKSSKIGRTDGVAEQVLGEDMKRFCVSGNSLKVMFPARPFAIHTVGDATLLWGRAEQIATAREASRFADVTRLSPAFVAKTARDQIIEETEQRLSQAKTIGISPTIKPWSCQRYGTFLFNKDEVRPLRMKIQGRQAHLLMATAVAGLKMRDWIDIPLNAPDLETYGTDKRATDPIERESEKILQDNIRKRIAEKKGRIPSALIGSTGGPTPSVSASVTQMEEIRHILKRVRIETKPLTQQDPIGYQAALERIDQLVLDEVQTNTGRYHFGSVDTREAQLWVDAFSCIAKVPKERSTWCGNMAQGILNNTNTPKIADTTAEKEKKQDSYCWAMAFTLATTPIQRVRMAPQLAALRRHSNEEWINFAHQVTEDLRTLNVSRPDDWMAGMEDKKAPFGMDMKEFGAIKRMADDRFSLQLQQIVLDLEVEPMQLLGPNKLKHRKL